METPKSGSAGDSPILNVSKALAASWGGDVCVCVHAWACGALPSWWVLRPGLLRQPVSPAGAAPSLSAGFGVTAGVQGCQPGAAIGRAGICP